MFEFHSAIKNKLRQINQEIQRISGLEVLTYRRFYQDKIVYIFNNDTWLNHSINNEIFYSDTFKKRIKELSHRDELFYVWPRKTQDSVYQQLYAYGFCNGFIYYNKTPGYYEAFAFTAKGEIDFNSLLNGVVSIRNITTYFKEQMFENINNGVGFQIPNDNSNILDLQYDNKEKRLPISNYPVQCGGKDFLISKREAQVLQLLSRNNTYKAIASKLAISPRTVETHITRLKNKLSIYNNVDLANVFMQSIKEL